MNGKVIGCFGAYPGVFSPTSGYLIEENGIKILLDCGSGVLLRLQEWLPLSELDAVVISHYHPDHCADLGCLQYAVMIDRQLGRRTKAFSAWGPDEQQRLSYKEYCTGHSYLEKDSFRIGGMTFETMENIHEIPSFAIKVTGADGKVLVYSGDTGYQETLADFAAGADCFICEASFYQYQQNLSQEHLTSVQAAQLAEKAGAKRLILTHLPHYGEWEQLRQEAAAHYQGEILLAEPGLVF